MGSENCNEYKNQKNSQNQRRHNLVFVFFPLLTFDENKKGGRAACESEQSNFIANTSGFNADHFTKEMTDEKKKKQKGRCKE